MAVSASDLTKLYLAYFGRPPDFDGMVYYTSQSSLTLQQIAANFSASPESQALYGASSLSGVIDSIYMNLFNRHAEPGGLLYWSTEIASGRITPAFAAYAILIGAQNADAVTVANKLQVATDWLAHLDTSAEITGYAGADAAQVARTFLATVDSTTSSVTNAEAGLDAAIAAAVNASVPGPLNIAISSPSVVEGQSGTKELSFVITLSHASASAVTVSYSTGGGTATAGDDYQGTAGSITFQPGQTTAVVNVTVFGDITVEDDETVGLTITGTTIGNSGVTNYGKIVNDDVNPVLTTGIDTINVVGTGANIIKGIVDGGTPANSTFSNGDTINGNGQTVLQLLVATGGTGAIAFVDNVAEVDVIAGTPAAIRFSAIEWTNVGSVNLSGGVSGATLTVDSLADTVDLGIGATVGGTIIGNYQDGLGVTLVNSGKGGASYEASAGDVTVHLNTNGASGGAFFTGNGDITVGNVTVDGNADSATAFFGAQASGDLTVGAVAESAGDNAAAVVSVTATGDVSIASIAQNVGNSASDIVVVGTTAAAISGDIVIGGIAQVAGTSGFASITVNGSGDITLGDLLQQVGSGTAAAAQIHVYDLGGGNVSIGNVTQGAGNSVSMSVSTTGTGTVTVGDVAQGASTSNAFLGIYTDLGSITVGDVSQTVGDSATASVSLDVRSSGTSTTSVADITVGNISQIGGDGANVHVDLSGAGATTSGAATIGGALNVGGVSQVVGDSGSMTVSLTSTFGGVITVGDVSQSGGDSATASVYVSGSSDVTVGDVTIAIGDGVTKTARFQAYADGDLSVGNVDVSVGAGSALRAWATVSNATGHDLTVGDVNISVGDLTTSAGTRPWGYFGAFNQDASGDLTVGNVAMNLGITGTGAITISQSNATSLMDGGSVTVGNVSLTLADKAIVQNVWIHNNATVATSVSHTTLSNLGDLTVGNIAADMGTNAAVSVTVSETMTGTGGDVGTVKVGDISIVADVNAYANVQVLAANYAGGDMAGVEIGDVSFNMDDGGSFTLNVAVSDTSGALDHFTMGDVSVDLGVSGDILAFTANVRAGSIGAATMGDVSISLGEHATGASIDLTVSATTGDLGDVTIGDITLNIGQSASLGADVNVNIASAGDIASANVGKIVHIVADSGGAADTTTSFVNITAAGDIGSVHLGGLQQTMGANANGDGLRAVITAGGDIGSVVVDGVTAHIGSSSYVSDIFELGVFAANIGNVTLGDHTVQIDASGSRTSYDNVTISATADVGNVTFGDIVYHLDAGAMTSDGINRTITAGGDVGNVTVGDVGMYAATSASFTSGFQLNVTAGGDVGDVTVGNVTVQGTSASDSMTAAFNVSGANIGDVMFGDLDATNKGTAGFLNKIAINLTAATAIGNVEVGDVGIHLSGASATVSLNIAAASASGDLTIGDVDMGLITTAATPLTGGVGTFVVNANVVTGDVSMGTVSFDGTTAATLSASVNVTGANSVDLGGIDVKGSGVFGADYILTVNAGAADVMVGTIKMEDSGANNLTTVLGGINTTGTISLGTVDYSNHTGGAAIDVSPYAGNIHVIGSSGADTITSNTESDTLTGGAGTDAFVITDQAQDLTTLAGFHTANVVTITDFKAGPTFAETIAVDAEHTTVAYYSEKTAASADAAFTLALSTMSDPTQQSDVVAVQVGGDVYVFIDQDGGNDVDTIVKLSGVSNSALNFADFIVS